MKNKYRLLFIVIITFMITSCSHKVSRVNYKKPEGEIKFCEVPIKRFYKVNSSNTKQVGKLELKDSGFSVSCNEIKAMTILMQEACAQQADLIVITSEERPNIKSSCYRCKAEFYQFTGDSIELKKASITSDFDSFEAAKRVIEDKKKNRTIFWTSLGVGVVVGLLMSL